MSKIDIGLIILGVLGTIILLMGLMFAIALTIVIPSFVKIFGIFFVLVMIFFIIALWVLILT